MKKNSAFFAILASGLLFASCAGEEIPGYSDSDLNDTPPVVEEPVPDNPIAENVPIEFEIPVSTLTKATLDLEDGMTVNWQDGDRVGVFYRYTPEGGSATIASKACNVPYEYDAETGKFVAVDTPAYWDEGAAAASHAMYVYYPYNENSTDVTAIAGSLPVEQNYDAAATQNSVASYGCYAGVARNIQYGKPVTFGSLYHQFGMMRLEIRNTTGSDIVIGKVQVESTKSLAGDFVFRMSSLNDQKIWPFTTFQAKKTVTINVENGAVAAGEAVDVRFLMRPGDCSGQTFNVTVTTVGGETYTVDFQGVGTLIGGQRVAKPFNLTSPYKVKDVVDGGVLFKINGDNTGGLVLFPVRGGSKTLNEDGTYTNTLSMGLIDTGSIDLSTLPEASTDDGAVNVAILKQVDPTLENCPAVKACEDLGSRIGGNWYLPAKEEWKTLLGVYNGTGWTSGDVLTGAPSEEETNARAEFDSILTAQTTDDDRMGDGTKDKGTRINLTTSSSGTEYWSSTWNSEGKGTVFCAYKIKYKAETLTSTNSIRCIKKVNFADLQNSTEENPTEE